MGSKPDTSGADEANQIAREEQKAAREKERIRQEHLDTGKKKIDQIFGGAPVMGHRQTAFDWSKFAPATTQRTYDRNTGTWKEPTAAANVPAGYTAVQVADPNYKAPKGGSGMTRSTGSHMENVGSYKALGNPEGKDAWARVPNTTTTAVSTDPNAGKIWALKGPDGKIYTTGQNFNYDETYDTGQRSGGFDDAFYKGVEKDYTAAGQTDITDQYNKARENLQYALARQGLSSSSAGNQGAVDLTAANTKAEGDLNLQAKDAVSQIKTQVEQEKANAINQLYATEDPTLAANTATSRMSNIQADKPEYSGLGDIFGSVIQGFGNVYNATRGANAGYGYQKQPGALSASGH